jgi:hypothetical protein
VDCVIEPSPQPPAEPQRSVSSGHPRTNPIVLEDLAAVMRIPALFQRVTKVLDHARAVFVLPDDAPFLLVDPHPGDGHFEYGYRWMDKNNLLCVFVGMSWGDQGNDPLWEVRVEAGSPMLAEMLRSGNWHRLAARRAESRFSDWGKFWHEDLAGSESMLGASAAVTRFMEEDNAEHMAAEYLAGAFYALFASGALSALLEVARQHADPGLGPSHGNG